MSSRMRVRRIYEISAEEKLKWLAEVNKFTNMFFPVIRRGSGRF